MTKVRNKSEVIAEARTKGHTVHFASFNRSRSSQKFGVGATIEKIQRSSRTPRWRCRGWFRFIRRIYWTRIISFTNDGSKSNGREISRQDKQQTQYQLTPRSEWKMLHLYWRSKNQNVQIKGYVYQNTNGQDHGPAWKIQTFLLHEICTVTLRQDCYGKGNSRIFFKKKKVGEKFQIGNVYSLTEKIDCSCREKGLFLSVYVDDIELAGKKQNLDPMLNIFMKEVDLGDPTSILDHVYFGSTHRECKTSKDIADNYRDLFKSRMSAGAKEKLLYSEKNRRQTSHLGPMVWKIVRKNAWKDIAN